MENQLIINKEPMNNEIKYSQELLDMLQPGKKIRLFYNDGNPNNVIRHIRAVVDNEYIVYKVWLPRKKYWDYRIEWIYGFHLAFETGVIIEHQ